MIPMFYIALASALGAEAGRAAIGAAAGARYLAGLEAGGALARLTAGVEQLPLEDR